MRLSGSSIGGRLGTAFGLSALLAVIACVIGLYSYQRLSPIIRQVSEVDLAATAAAAKVAQISAGITAFAPLLAQSNSPGQIDEVMTLLNARMAEMKDALRNVDANAASTAGEGVANLAKSLDAIRAKTTEALQLRDENESILREVRGLHSDFVEESEPLVEDGRFMIQSTLERMERGQAVLPESIDDVRRRLREAETILQASSQANLAVGILGRIAAVQTVEQLTIDGHFLLETTELIKSQLGTMQDSAELLTLRQILGRLIELSDGAGGLPSARLRQLDNRKNIDQLLAENRRIIRELDQHVAGLVASTGAKARRSSSEAEAAISTGQNLLSVIAFAAVIAAILMGVFYVRGSLISRISDLAAAARLLGEGRVPPPIEVRGSDELSDMARAMESFRRSQNDLVQTAKLAALGHLSAGIAHELNQPLNAIRSQAYNARVLQQRGDLAGAAAAITKVESLTGRAGLVVNQLRRFARRSEQSLTAVVIREAAEAATVILASKLRESGVMLKIDLPDTLIAEADEVRLEQVFVNLVGNAIDALAGRDNPRIDILGDKSNNVTRITVKDNGPGIAPDVAGTLFDPFITTKPPGEGVGLGLAICYNIIRDFGGAISVEPGADGAVFVIELRTAEGAAA